jgi:SAM-dependent methyltransferase
LTEALTALAARARCPACGEAPLSIKHGALVCRACAAPWQLVSRQPLAVRLAKNGTGAVGEQFRGPPLAGSRMRRAVWRWHARRDERFLSRMPALSDSQLPAIRAAYEELPAGRRSVLDVGGGSGRWRRLLGNPADYTIVDVVAPENLPLDLGLTYVVGDAAALPFASGAFGLVLMIEVLHHLPEPALALAEVRRVLAPDGVLVLTTRQAWRTHGAPNDYFRYTRYGLEHLLRSAGLRRQLLIPLGGPASVITVALENNLPLLTKPFVKQIVCYPLWRLAAFLDRTLFRENLTGLSSDVSGWLLIARAGERHEP